MKRNKTETQLIKRSFIHIQKLKGKKSLFEMSKSYEDKDKSLEKEITKLPIKKRIKVEQEFNEKLKKLVKEYTGLVYLIGI